MTAHVTPRDGSEASGASRRPRSGHIPVNEVDEVLRKPSQQLVRRVLRIVREHPGGALEGLTLLVRRAGRRSERRRHVAVSGSTVRRLRMLRYGRRGAGEQELEAERNLPRKQRHKHRQEPCVRLFLPTPPSSWIRLRRSEIPSSSLTHAGM